MCTNDLARTDNCYMHNDYYIENDAFKGTSSTVRRESSSLFSPQSSGEQGARESTHFAEWPLNKPSNDSEENSLISSPQPSVGVGRSTHLSSNSGDESSNDPEESDHEEDSDDPNILLNRLRANNINRPIIAHLNINFLDNKFEPLKSLIKDKVDILFLSETKLDATFPPNQFAIEGFSKAIRLDRNRFGGGVLFFIRDNLPFKELKSHNLPIGVEGIFIELMMGKNKWLIMGGYNPHKDNIPYFLSKLGDELDKFLLSYDNILLLGDFNATVFEDDMKVFCETYNLKNLINEPTCYKNPSNPSSIDVMLTNRKNCFQNSITIETGLSDFHKMTLAVLKTHFKKKDPIVVNYRNYKYFDEQDFKSDLTRQIELLSSANVSYDDFKQIFMAVLDSHAPKKKVTVRGNNAPFMNKTLSKAFMHRSKLKNRFNKNPTEENKTLYKKQRNFCVSLLRKEKKKYYNNLDMKIFNDNNKFWKAIKPLFSEKHDTQRNIIIVENEKITTDKKEVAEKFNNYFIEAVENLDIEPFDLEDHNVLSENIGESIDDIDIIISKYSSHPSILKIKENVNPERSFQFKDITSEEMETEIRNINLKKSSMENDIPAKALKLSHDIISNNLSTIYNNSKNNEKFPVPLKFADVTPIHKAKERTVLKNYRPVSLIPIVAKLFERNMHEQISTYIDKFLSPYLFGYRKGHSTEQCLLIMTETWKKALDEKCAAGAILTDLSKAFDCLSHDLLIAKLEAYGFEKSALKFIYDYLRNRKQRTKVGNFYSLWRELIHGVPQGSILGPLLFNIFLNDIFYFLDKSRMANYADDNTIYSVDENVEKLLDLLKNETSTVLKWFKTNEMKSNSDKCHLLVATNDNVSVNIETEIIESSNSVELLGIKIDNKLNFNDHVSNLCKRGNQKLHSLARISKYLCHNKLKLLMKTFIESQFNYCPLLWMFHSRALNNRINTLHERALRIVYQNNDLTFQELLEKDGSVTIHDRNLQKLAIEMFKVKHNLSPLPVQEIFSIQNTTYNLRNNRNWQIPRVRTVNYGTDTIRYRGPITWELLPVELKNMESLINFKREVKKWKPQGCTCRLCKEYVHNLGFLT